MPTDILISLLSGLIGALIATVITIGYTEYKERKDKKLRVAREKLEKVYGPLVALKKKIDLLTKSEHAFLMPSNPVENKLVEKVIFQYYHLIDDDLKDELPLLHSQLRNDITNQIKFPGIYNKIKKHYQENKDILGI